MLLFYKSKKNLRHSLGRPLHSDIVSEYGKGLLEFIQKNDGQTILDLGCGTGVMTAQLRDFKKKF